MGEGQILEYVLVAVMLTIIKIESDTIKQFFDRARVGLFNRDVHLNYLYIYAYCRPVRYNSYHDRGGGR